ncbi:uncharacterized protein LOC124935564 [Impatiens glandulifera]|uniref:uncharacterized protein LOC124935564 n=1 Tax=Impatiens glandulifera TaxID=253017 RepID=UPI001FB0C1BF|nr:uncharacterized protein LOC124935564 [Impatiens glandulifera]
MSFLKGSSTWEPVMTRNTSSLSYWFNWRVMVCSIWLIISLVFSFFLISKYEGWPKGKNRVRFEEQEQEVEGILYEDEVWRPCLRGIHPGWLLVFRVLAFVVILSVLVLNVAVDGINIFYYYTQ